MRPGAEKRIVRTGAQLGKAPIRHDAAAPATVTGLKQQPHRFRTSNFFDSTSANKRSATMLKRCSLPSIIIFLTFWQLHSATLCAAETEPGTTEAAAFGGLVAGVGTHGTLGGGVAYAATKRVWAVGEFSYIPGPSEMFAVLGVVGKMTARAYDFNAGIHYQFPTKELKAVPYVASGLGGLRGSASARVTYMGQSQVVKESDTSFYFNVGGGLRYRISGNWGIRPELKIFAGDDTFVRVAIGIFYQFGK